MGHIIREGSDSAMYKATFRRGLQRPCDLYKRVGKPRGMWAEMTLGRIWKKLMEEEVEARNIAEVEFDWEDER